MSDWKCETTVLIGDHRLITFQVDHELGPDRRRGTRRWNMTVKGLLKVWQDLKRQSARLIKLSNLTGGFLTTIKSLGGHLSSAIVDSCNKRLGLIGVNSGRKFGQEGDSEDIRAAERHLVQLSRRSESGPEEERTALLREVTGGGWLLT